MGGTFAALAMLATGTICAAEREPGAYTRQALRDHFRYQSQPGTNAPGPTPAEVTVSSPADAPEAVALPTFEVEARALDRGLVTAMANARSPEPQKRGKFGTGVQEKDFGKVRAFTVTVLYIPIFVGVRW